MHYHCRFCFIPAAFILFMEKKNIKKENKFQKRYIIIPVIMFVYVTAMVCIFIPNSEDSTSMKIIEVAGAYIIVFLLFLALKKKDKLKKERENEMKKYDNEK